jgi:transposase
MVRLTNE